MKLLRSPRVLLPFAHRDFRLLLVGQTVSNFGNTFWLVALPFQLIALGPPPLQLGIAIARTAGPIVAGVVVAYAGTPQAFAIDALTFVFSFLTYLAANPTASPMSAPAPILRQVREGLSFVASTRWLWMALLE